MTPEQKAAFVIAMCVQGWSKICLMHAQNLQAVQRGEALFFSEADFNKVIEDYGLHNNALITFFND